MPDVKPIEMEMEDVITCVHFCMEVGGPHEAFAGAIAKAFPGQVNVNGAPLKTLQDLWRKYYAKDKAKSEEVKL